MSPSSNPTDLNSKRPIQGSFIEQLKSTTDIVSVIGNSVKLKPSSGGRYTGLCPFHKEKTPSFSVNAVDNIYHCFGCKESGDTIKFVMTTEGMDFYDAIHRLAEMQSIPVQYTTSANTTANKVKGEDYSLVQLALEFYASQLPQHKLAQDYFSQRGVSENLLKEYQLGYAPPGYDNLLNQLKDDEQKQIALRLGLVKASENNKDNSYDVLRDRVIFPILDMRRRPLGFGGRVINDDSKEAKYINSADSDIFHKQQNMFGLPQALASKVNQRLMLVEGYMDVLALAGIERAVACLGTAFSSHHAKILFARTDVVVLAFDGDEAGVKAAERAILQCLPILDDKKELLIKLLPFGKDPYDLVYGGNMDADVAARKRAWQAVKEASLEDYLLRPFNSSMPPATARVAINNLAEALAQMRPGSTRVAVVRKRAEQMLGGIGIMIPNKFRQDSKRGRSAKSSSAKKTQNSRVWSKPPSLEQKLLFQLLINPRNASNILDRWGRQLEEAAAMVKGQAATRTLGIMLAARQGTAHLYGYAVGSGYSLVVRSSAWDSSINVYIQKILLSVYKEELKYATTSEDKDLQHRLRDLIKQKS